MSGSEWALVASVFLACTVEAVEALTIVLAVGVTRDWRSALYGAAAAALVLAVIVAALGPAVNALPIDALRVAVGGLLLVFGLQWLRKAILRAGGVKALHDEDSIFREQQAHARDAGGRPGGAIDGYSLAIAFKGVLLEGLEVAFIVVTFGANQHRIGLAAIAAAAAVAVVIIAGFAVRGPLASVPENALKFAVGILLTSFGTFWSTEGAGARWPGADGALLVIIAVMAIASAALVFRLRGRSGVGRPAPTAEGAP
jgi:uncharacterized membrane protein